MVKLHLQNLKNHEQMFFQGAEPRAVLKERALRAGKGLPLVERGLDEVGRFLLTTHIYTIK